MSILDGLHGANNSCRDGKCCPGNFDETLMEVILDLKEIVSKKQKDYGPQNILDFGELGLLIRTNDKISRLKTLLKAESPNFESIDDTWTDIAGYAILALILKKGGFKQE